MKNYQPEASLFLQDQAQIFRLAQLSQNNNNLFYEVSAVLPYSVAINKRIDLGITYCNAATEKWLGKSCNELEQAGPGFIADLADAPIYKFALEKIAAFDQANDPNVACGYFHRLRLGNEMRWLYVHKVLLNDCSYLNIAYRLDQLGRPGKIIAQTLGDNLVSEVGWQRFQSLTKREKQILLLIADGRETSQIADELFISKATAKTHRRNMMNKIEARNLIEALRFADALKLLGVQVF